jgi:hypothetical protein
VHDTTECSGIREEKERQVLRVSREKCCGEKRENGIEIRLCERISQIPLFVFAFFAKSLVKEIAKVELLSPLQNKCLPVD